MSDSEYQQGGHAPLFGLLAGPCVFVFLILLPPPANLGPDAWAVAATTVLMVIWWITEAVPVAVTALLPVALFPLLGIAEAKDVAAPYAHPLIFLFLGGFLIAKGVERWNLHRRIALTILKAVGSAPDRLIAGFMGASAALSMWLSNTATTIMMVPIALAVVAMLDRKETERQGGFAVALLLGIAYAASIGGIGTLIGTPPNALLAAFLAERYGLTIGFGRWMLFGVPLAAILLLLAWLLLTRFAFKIEREPIPGASETIAAELRGLGPIARPEGMVAAVFASVAVLWVLRPIIETLPLLSGLSDPVIAMLGGVSLFVIPASLKPRRFLLDWDAAKTLPWGVLILFGGGLSLASAIQASGLAAWVGEVLEACAGWPVIAVILLVTAIVVFLTEVTSNTATASVFIPIAATLGACTADSAILYAVPVALAASCAFMMPVATPPNAIVFASGRLRIAQMARAGFLLNIACTVIISVAVYLAAEALLGGGVTD